MSDKAQKLKEILTLLSDSLTKKDFEDAFVKVVEYVKGIDTKTSTELSAIKEAVNSAIARIEDTAKSNHADVSEQLTAKAEQAINDITFAKESFLAEAQAKLDAIRDGLDGEDADEEEIVERVLARVPAPVVPEIDLSEVYEEIDDLKKKQENTRSAPFIGPSRGVFLHINGVKKGLINAIDIIGSGVAWSVVNGLATITITGGSGGSSVGTPTGTVDGSNTVFTFANTPTYIIVDGISKFATTHYTYVGTTLTITDGAPPIQFIRVIF